MQMRVLAGLFSSVAMSLPRPADGAHLRRRYVLAIACSIMVGLGMSVWLAIDPPENTPTGTSYMPAD